MDNELGLMPHSSTWHVLGYYLFQKNSDKIFLQHWRRVVSHPDLSLSHQAHLTMLQ